MHNLLFIIMLLFLILILVCLGAIIYINITGEPILFRKVEMKVIKSKKYFDKYFILLQNTENKYKEFYFKSHYHSFGHLIQVAEELNNISNHTSFCKQIYENNKENDVIMMNEIIFKFNNYYYSRFLYEVPAWIKETKGINQNKFYFEYMDNQKLNDIQLNKLHKLKYISRRLFRMLGYFLIILLILTTPFIYLF